MARQDWLERRAYNFPWTALAGRSEVVLQPALNVAALVSVPDV